MKYYICIDDTDNIDSIGTGTIADQIRQLLVEKGFKEPSLVTRHQLFIHPDIPYTSHNSSMCFTICGPETAFDQLISLCSAHLEKVAAVGSDPGLCILPFNAANDYKALVAYGKSAKITVLDKESAYACARLLNAHLSEHGGTGDGIIGALAGVGLRLSGSDGEVKASLKNFTIGTANTVKTLKERPEIDAVIDFHSKTECPDTETIQIDQRTKTVLYNHQYVLFVRQNAVSHYSVLGKAEIRQLGETFYA